MRAFKPTIVSKEKGRDPQGRKETETKAHTGTNGPAMTVKYAPEEGQKARKSARPAGARRSSRPVARPEGQKKNVEKDRNHTEEKIQSERCNSAKETESVVIPTDKGVEQKNPIGEM